MRGVVLLLAAGEGRRLGAGPKAFLELAGVTLFRRSAESAARAKLVDGIVAAVPSGRLDEARAHLSGLAATVVAGGDTRQASALAALEAAGGAEAVAVHDAARPLCPSWLFDSCLEALDQTAGAVAAAPLRDTVKRAPDGVIAETVDRAALYAVQTPQAFVADVYRHAHEAARRDGFEGTDDASLVERIGEDVRIVEGPAWNIKITGPGDVMLAEAILKAAPK